MRNSLFVCLLLSAAFAAWAWLRPYDWNPDPEARATVVSSMVTRDRSYYWVDVHVRVNPEASHDLQKPSRLLTANGKSLEPADTTLASKDGKGTSDIWFKFWLEPNDLEGSLALKINDGELEVKSSGGLPDLGRSNFRNFTTRRW